MDPFSAYKQPTTAIRDETTFDRYRDPHGATRFVQLFLVMGVVQFTYVSIGLVLGLNGQSQGMLPHDSTIIMLMLAISLTSKGALAFWAWRVRTNLLALNEGIAPNPILTIISALCLMSLGAALEAAHLASWQLALFAFEVAGAGYACYAIGWIVRFDPTAAPDRRGRPTPLLRAWWMLVLANAIVPIGLSHRHVPADQAVANYQIAALCYYLFATAACLVLILLAGAIARRQVALHGTHRPAGWAPSIAPSRPD